jgi:hypothetical protein
LHQYVQDLGARTRGNSASFVQNSLTNARGAKAYSK